MTSSKMPVNEGDAQGLSEEELMQPGWEDPGAFLGRWHLNWVWRVSSVSCGLEGSLFNFLLFRI